MSYDAKITSRKSAKPVELYLFRTGPNPGDYYAYNDGLEDITFGSLTPTAVMFVVERAGALAGEKMDTIKAGMTLVFDKLAQNVLNGWQVDVGLVTYGPPLPQPAYGATREDILTMAGLIDDLEAEGSDADFEAAAEEVSTFFAGVDAGVTRRIVVWLTAGISDPAGTETPAAAILSAIAPAVDVHVLNIVNADTTVSDVIDDTPADGVPVIAANDGEAISDYVSDLLYDLVYTTFPINRDTINANGTLDKANLTVTTAASIPLAVAFQEYPPSEVVSLFIRQGHIDDEDNEFLVIWAGRVLSCQFTDSECEFTCEPVATSLRRAGLRRNWQLGCPLVLYGIGDRACNANKAAQTVATTASAVGQATVTLPVGWAADPLNFRQGVVEWTNSTNDAREIRTILRVDPDTRVLTLAGVTRGLSPAQAINVVRGCNHQPDGCELHDNIHNYGGQPFIPTKNPFRGSNNFY